MKNRWLYIVICTLVLGCLAWSCTGDVKRSNDSGAVPNAEVESTRPHCRLLIQPYGDFSSVRAQEVAEGLKKSLDTYVKDLAVTEVRVLPAKPLTEDLMNEAKTRYRAGKILDKQVSLMSRNNDVIIGLTDCDISTTAHGYADWGIMGMAEMGNSNCVISTFRVKDKTQFWKVVLHEFGHGFLGLDHCPNNDPQCFMVDCNGKPDLAKEKYLCDTCANSIRL